MFFIILLSTPFKNLYSVYNGKEEPLAIPVFTYNNLDSRYGEENLSKSTDLTLAFKDNIPQTKSTSVTGNNRISPEAKLILNSISKMQPIHNHLAG